MIGAYLFDESFKRYPDLCARRSMRNGPRPARPIWKIKSYPFSGGRATVVEGGLEEGITGGRA